MPPEPPRPPGPLTSTPFFFSIFVSSAMLCCALATASPYPGTNSTRLADVSDSTTSGTEISWCVPVTAIAAPPVPVP
jgi:hypothetical protein